MYQAARHGPRLQECCRCLAGMLEMGRVIAVQPAQATSTLVFRVRFCETDLMGIVHHANDLPYFEMGRVE